jgi:aryl-alcohol dehydrogenase-like predicted oxidoreductase
MRRHRAHGGRGRDHASRPGAAYGDGKAEEVVGEVFGGKLPEGVRVTSKCNLGEPPAAEIEPLLRRSIEGSLARLRQSRLDLFFLHSNVVPDAGHRARRPEAVPRMTLMQVLSTMPGRSSNGSSPRG